MPQANSAHSSAGMMLNASSANARAEPVNTGNNGSRQCLGTGGKYPCVERVGSYCFHVVLLESYTTKIAKGFVIFALLFG